jgi:hypothetical protein
MLFKTVGCGACWMLQSAYFVQAMLGKDVLLPDQAGVVVSRTPWKRRDEHEQFCLVGMYEASDR